MVTLAHSTAGRGELSGRRKVVLWFNNVITFFLKTRFSLEVPNGFCDAFIRG